MSAAGGVHSRAPDRLLRLGRRQVFSRTKGRPSRAVELAGVTAAGEWFNQPWLKLGGIPDKAHP